MRVESEYYCHKYSHIINSMNDDILCTKMYNSEWICDFYNNYNPNVVKFIKFNITCNLVGEFYIVNDSSKLSNY